MTFEVTIKRDDLWPTPWGWRVICREGGDFTIRSGCAMTKDRARKKALKAKRSIEDDDVKVSYQ